jgi:RimJ/RimL family protein N-acetyltransferase
LAVHGGRVIAELADGTPVGDLTWFGVPYGPNKASVAWRIGITIATAYRGNGYGAVSQRLLAEHLLATTPSNRVEADTDLDNVAEQRALERAGFRREAVIAAAQWRRGRWYDRVLYALVREPAG